MPHKKSIPRSLHRARHEIGITFSFQLSPNLSPKKSLRAVFGKQEPSNGIGSKQSQFLDTAADVDVAAGLIDLLNGEAVKQEWDPPSSQKKIITKDESYDEKLIEEKVAVDPNAHHLIIGQPTLASLENDTNTNQTSGDDEEVITSYNLLPTIKTISSITLMRRLQSHSPPKSSRMIRSNYLSSSINPLTSSASKVAEKGGIGGKKRRVAQVSSIPGECIWCGTHKTAQWRKGPIGARSLCNRCGIEWAKHIKNEAKALSISIWEAEESLIQQYKSGERFQQYRKYPESPSVTATPSEA